MEKFKDVSPEEENKKTNTWESKRDALLEGIDKRLEVMLSMRSIIDGLSSKDSHEKVEATLEEFFLQTSQNFPQGVNEGLKRLPLLEKEMSETLVIIEVAETQGFTPQEKIDELHQKTDLLYDERTKILDDKDTFFAFELNRIVNDLVEKNRFIKDHESDESFFIKDAQRKSEDVPKRMKEVRVDAFDVSFIADDESWEEGSKGNINSNGFHIPNTPYVFAREREEGELERTIRHEKVHNELDSAVSLSESNPQKFIAEAFERYERYKKLNMMPDVVIDRFKTQIYKWDADKVIDFVHNEIVAGYDGAQRLNFSILPPEHTFHSIYRHSDKDKQRQTYFELTARSFSSAGHMIREVDLFLKEKAESVDDPKLAQHCRDLRDSLQKKFIHIISILKTVTSISNHISEDAKSRVDLLVTLMKPSEYRHIETYLEYKYGDKVDEAKKDIKRERDRLLIEQTFGKKRKNKKK